jgi:hypothetical protein
MKMVIENGYFLILNLMKFCLGTKYVGEERRKRVKREGEEEGEKRRGEVEVGHGMDLTT